MTDKEHTRSVSESENPVIPSPTPKTIRPRTNKDWWPNQLDLSVLPTTTPTCRIQCRGTSTTRRSSIPSTSRR